MTKKPCREAAYLNLTVERSVIAHNDPFGIDNGGWMSLINTTVSGNKWGIVASSGYTKLTHVTVAGNGKRNGSGSGLQVGWPVDYNAREIHLINTIVANNAGQQCDIHSGSLFVKGSLFSDISCGTWFPSGSPGDNLNADPKLWPFTWSKLGDTYVYALKAGSPAIDAGDPASCVSEDQRGVFRPIDGDGDGEANCDIGAYERISGRTELNP